MGFDPMIEENWKGMTKGLSIQVTIQKTDWYLILFKTGRRDFETVWE